MKTKKKMTVLAIVIVIAAILLVPNWQTDAAAFRGKGNWCDIRGTWYGASPYGSYMVNYDGAHPFKGTIDLVWISGDPTLGGDFPDAVWTRHTRGVWVRTGPNTFDFTVLTFSTNSAYEVLYIFRSNGTNTLVDCNTNESTANLEFLTPDMDPIDDDGLCIASGEVEIERRITLKEPCEE
jgi:hypothetical protein